MRLSRRAAMLLPLPARGWGPDRAGRLITPFAALAGGMPDIAASSLCSE